MFSHSIECTHRLKLLHTQVELREEDGSSSRNGWSDNNPYQILHCSCSRLHHYQTCAYLGLWENDEQEQEHEFQWLSFVSKRSCRRWIRKWDWSWFESIRSGEEAGGFVVGSCSLLRCVESSQPHCYIMGCVFDLSHKAFALHQQSCVYQLS